MLVTRDWKVSAGELRMGCLLMGHSLKSLVSERRRHTHTHIHKHTHTRTSQGTGEGLTCGQAVKPRARTGTRDVHAACAAEGGACAVWMGWGTGAGSRIPRGVWGEGRLEPRFVSKDAYEQLS